MAKSNIGNVQVKLNLDTAAFTKGLTASQDAMKAFSTALGAVGIGFGAIQIKDFISNVSKVSVEMDGLTNKFNAAAGGAMLGANSMQFVRDESEKLGLVFESTAVSFSGFEAAALRSGLTLNQTKEIFDNIARAATSLHLTGDKTELVFLALEQMASKGVVSMEELRRQLGDSLPGAFEIAAKSMGVSTAAFNKMVSDGKVMSADFLPKFARAVREELGGEAEKAATQANAAFNRYQNSLFNISDTIGDGLNPALASLAQEMTAIITSTDNLLKSTQNWANNNQSTIQITKDVIVGLSGIALATLAIQKAVIPAIAAMKAYEVAMQAYYASMLGGRVVGLNLAKIIAIDVVKGFQVAAVAVRAFTLSLLACPWTYVALAIGGVSYAIARCTSAHKEFTEATDNAAKKAREEGEANTNLIGEYKRLLGITNKTKEDKQRLSEIVQQLCAKYPEYIGRLTEELKMHGKISEALAKEIVLRQTAAQINDLMKKQDREIMWSNATANYFDKSDALNKEVEIRNKTTGALKDIIKEQKQQMKELTSVELGKSKIKGFDNSPVGGKGKTAAQLAAEEKRRKKEELDYKLALLDVEKYETQKTDEEIYQIELQQANIKIASAKKGTSDYAQALAAKYKLEQEHAQKLRDLHSQQIVDNLEYQKEEIDNIIQNLELQYDAQVITKEQLLQAEIHYINQKRQLEKDALDEQLKLVKGNAAEEVKIKRASNREQQRLNIDAKEKEQDLWNEQHRGFTRFSEDVSNGWGNTISDIISGNAKLSEAFSSLGNTMLSSFGNAMGEIAAKWIKDHLVMMNSTKLFASAKIAWDKLINISNLTTATTNQAVALSSTEAAAAQSASAGIMKVAALGFAAVAKIATGPIQELAGAMFKLAISSAIVAIAMPIIAISTAIVALTSTLAALGIGFLNVVMGITAATAMLFAPISLLLAAEFTLIAISAQMAADAVASLAIALAAASVAGIPIAGAVLAPMAAMATGAAIMAANSMVQFRESGGPVKKGQAYVVGEKRPELFVPDRDGTILPNTNAINGGSGGGDTYHYSAPITILATDAKSFENRIDDYTDRIHQNLFKGIKMRKFKPLAT